MNTNILIEHDIENLTNYIGRFNNMRDDVSTIESKLQSTLNQYYENDEKINLLYSLKNNISKLYDDHLIKCEHKNDIKRCAKNRTFIRSSYFVEQEIKSLIKDYSFEITRPELNIKLIKANIIQLDDYPEVSSFIIKAIEKLNGDNNERNILDDMRLSLEILLKRKFNNDKSIENQLENIGQYLKSRNTSKELVNMFKTMIDYYSKYQNSYVKHNDTVKKQEIDFIINITSSLIHFLINKD